MTETNAALAQKNDIYNMFISPTEMNENQPEELSSENPDQYFTQSEVTDIVAGRYKILLNKPIAALKNNFSISYEVEDLKLDQQKKYALVFNADFPIRVRAINILIRSSPTGFICPIDAQIVNLSNTKRSHAVVIMPHYDDLLSLEEYSKKHGAFEEDILLRNIIQPVATTLKKLHALEILHGRINVNNVFLNQKGKIIVGECISDTCGFSQSNIYEPIERMDLQNFGKDTKCFGADYHALGVLSLHMQLGRLPINQDDEEKMKALRYEKGSYEFISGSYKFSPNMKNFYRGTMSDRPKDRWGSKQVFDWLKGVRFSIIPSGENIEANRNIVFNDKYFLNRRGLVHELNENWDLAKKFLKEETVVKWLDRHLEESVTAERIQHLQDLRNSGRGLVYIEDDEFVSRCLFAMDPDKVIRYREVRIHGSTLGHAIAFSFANKNKEHLQLIAKLIVGNFYGMWQDTLQDNFVVPGSPEAQLSTNLPEFVKKPDLGFGLERCMYDLCPSLTCQSPILEGSFLQNVKALLEKLEKISKNPDLELVDRHISAFIASKLNIIAPFKINTLSKYPKFANNHNLLNLAILASAQKGMRVKNLKSLTKALSQKLYSVIDMINNVELKKRLMESLNLNAEKGDLTELFKHIVDPNTLHADQKGFERAVIQFRIYNREISKCNNKKRTLQMGYNIGLRICVVISYLICSIVLIVIMSRSL